MFSTRHAIKERFQVEIFYPIICFFVQQGFLRFSFVGDAKAHSLVALFVFDIAQRSDVFASLHRHGQCEHHRGAAASPSFLAQFFQIHSGVKTAFSMTPFSA